MALLIRKAIKCCIGVVSDLLKLFFDNLRRVAK